MSKARSIYSWTNVKWGLTVNLEPGWRGRSRICLSLRFLHILSSLDGVEVATLQYKQQQKTVSPLHLKYVTYCILLGYKIKCLCVRKSNTEIILLTCLTLAMVVWDGETVLCWLRQEGHRFKASLEYLVKPWLKKQRRGGMKEGRKGGREERRERGKSTVLRHLQYEGMWGYTQSSLFR